MLRAFFILLLKNTNTCSIITLSLPDTRAEREKQEMDYRQMITDLLANASQAQLIMIYNFLLSFLKG